MINGAYQITQTTWILIKKMFVFVAQKAKNVEKAGT